MSTIAAISSPIGAGGIGIVRVSGEEALKIADAIFHFSNKRQNWEPLKLNFGQFQAEDFCDKGYAVYFPSNKAFTGEDTVEFYLHGGVRIMQGALTTLLKNGAILAERGEFTKRAYLSGKMTLADSEGVIDMINAQSSAGVRAAYRLMDGNVAKTINGILNDLESLLATLEATLDYPDEMEDEVLPTLSIEIEKLIKRVETLLATAKCGKMAKHGITVVLAGDTNAGKSSLMNALLNDERAIVTDIAGTTRDTISESFEANGVKINLIDTAGIRESDDMVENAGIIKAKKAVANADIILNIIDSTKSKQESKINANSGKIFKVYNKCDISNINDKKIKNEFYISAKTGQGIDNLINSITDIYKQGEIEGGELITSQRHISALINAKRSLEDAKLSVENTIDLILIDLKQAYNFLGEITGKTATEDIVDRIFNKFCVGK